MGQVLPPIGPNRAAAILGHSDFSSAAGGGSFQVGDQSACAYTSMEPVEARAPQELSDHILATLAEIGEEINASLNLDKVLSKTAALVKRLVDYEIFCVMLLDQQSQTLSYRFAIGYSREVTDNWRLPVGQGIAGVAAATREPVRVSDVRTDPRYINAIDSVRSEMAVPLLFQDQVIGVLDIQSTQVDYFTHEQQEILVLLASRLATAIENARLFERARSQADTLLLLNEVGREASSILDVEALLRRSAELVKRVIDYQIMSIMLYDPVAKVFFQRLAMKYGQSVQGKLRVASTEGLIGAAAASGQPVRVPDVSKEPRYIMLNPETRSELSIPMIHKGRVDRGARPREPANSTISPRTMPARSPSWLRSWPCRWKTRASTSRWPAMKLAWSANCKPRSAFRAPCCVLCLADDFGVDLAARILSAREVCGDLYDFFRYGPTRVGFGLGDVSGKGSAAALYGAVAIGILRSLAPQKLLPGGIVEAAQPIDLRAPHRGPLPDLLLCHLAQAHAQAARGQRRADPAVSAAAPAIANS